MTNEERLKQLIDDHEDGSCRCETEYGETMLCLGAQILEGLENKENVFRVWDSYTWGE